MPVSNGGVHVRLTELTHGYVEGGQRHDVLRGVNAEFRRGESVALRGRSGSGKSTLLNLVCGIDLPDAGTVEIAGRNLTAMTERERTLFRRRHIGFVYQAFNLVPTLSVADNVCLVLELNGVARPDAGSRVRDLLDAVGLADRADSYPDVLSGGEQQRVAIARALAHRPTLVLADEPTGNLDEASAEAVLRLLDTMLRREGGTLLMATHSQHVAATCDRVFELQHGALVER